MAILMIFPLLWLVSTSLKEPSKQMIWPPQIIPNPLYPQNYVQLFVIAPMELYLYNSFKVTILSVIGTCFWLHSAIHVPKPRNTSGLHRVEWLIFSPQPCLGPLVNQNSTMINLLG